VSARAAALGLSAAAAALGGCERMSMNRQPKLTAQAPAPLFPRGTEQQAPPEGAVSQDAPRLDAEAATPPPVTAALVERGRERHDIDCRPCHGPAGAGNGTVVARGFPRPPAYWDPAVRGFSAAQLYDAITHGYGVMYPQAERVEPRDRWAIVAYIRATQIAALPPTPSSASAPQAPAPAP
jgi:mono/diheme cytochrome c family protein